MVSKEYASIITQTLKMYLLLAVSSLSGGMQNLLLGGTDSLVVVHGFRSMWAQ